MGMPSEIRAIYQQNIRIAIVVVIDEGTAWTHRLRQPLFSKGAVVMSEMNTSLLRDVAEMDLLGDGKIGRDRCYQENEDR